VIAFNSLRENKKNYAAPDSEFDGEQKQD